MCEHYNPRIAGSCSEDRAEEVREKERANFCDYFEPSSNAYQPDDNTKAQAARAGLEALFGLTTNQPEEKASSTDNQPKSKADTAKEELEKLFGLNEKNNKNE